MFRLVVLALLLLLSAQAAECGEVEWFLKPNGAALTRPAYTIKDWAGVEPKFQKAADKSRSPEFALGFSLAYLLSHQ